jgi:predicted dehydrogenase
MNPKLKFALFGAGFWSRFQLAGWYQVGGVECVAVYNRTRAKAERLASDFGIPRVYDNIGELFQTESPDFVDIVTRADLHPRLVRMSVERGIPVICQKPMAESLAECEEMTALARSRGVPLFINENWRWQTPMRALKAILAQGRLGQVFRARLRMASGFDLFTNQPFLKELEEFLLVDIGSHILDTARFLFGEARSLYCRTQRVRPDVRGEDVATVILGMASGATVTCEMGYARSPLEHDRFPQTFAFVEGTDGSVTLGPEYELRIHTAAGTTVEHALPPHYKWADPAYDVVHSSIVPCQADLLAGLRGGHTPETTGEDNLRTMRLVYSAYRSAREDCVIRFD